MFEFIFDTEERNGDRKGNGYEKDPKRREYLVTNIVLSPVGVNSAQIHQDSAHHEKERSGPAVNKKIYNRIPIWKQVKQERYHYGERKKYA